MARFGSGEGATPSAERPGRAGGSDSIRAHLQRGGVMPDLSVRNPVVSRRVPGGQYLAPSLCRPVELRPPALEGLTLRTRWACDSSGEGGGEWVAQTRCGPGVKVRRRAPAHGGRSHAMILAVDDWRDALWEGRGSHVGKAIGFAALRAGLDADQPKAALGPARRARVGPGAQSMLEALSPIRGRVRSRDRRWPRESHGMSTSSSGLARSSRTSQRRPVHVIDRPRPRSDDRRGAASPHGGLDGRPDPGDSAT